MVQMKEHIKTLEKELSNEEIDNQSDAEFKTLVIRLLTEMIEFSHEMKAKQRGKKENIQGTNSEGKETRTQINNLEQKEEINIQTEQNEETRIQKKMRRGSRTTLNIPTSNSKRCQKEKRKSKKLESYLNK